MAVLHRTIGLSWLVLAIVLAGCGGVQPIDPVDPTPRVVSVSIDQDDMSLSVGETAQLSATVEVVGGASRAVLWGTDDPTVATVDADGTVTAVGEGVAQITATSVVDSARFDSITVEVVRGVDFVIDAEGQVEFEPTALETITISANTIVLLEVIYPPSGADLMYLEIDPDEDTAGLQLELWDATADTRLLVSRSPDLFATTTEVLGMPADLIGSAQAVERSSITIGWTCFGPCVAQEYREGTSYARIVNASGSSRTVDVYAYGLNETDENEPNDTPLTATEVVVTEAGEVASGAIEHVDDLDYFRIECEEFAFPNVILELSSGFEGDIVLTADGQDYRPGEATDLLLCGSVVHVRTLDGTAGPSSASRYSIIIE